MSSTNTRKLTFLSSQDEGGGIETFLFEKGNTTWLAGQSQEYILSDASEKAEDNSKRFTISSAPSEKTVNISLRMSQSPFKQALQKVKPGETIQAHSVLGRFTWEEDNDEDVVLVAGGIGITPYRSILLERHLKGKKLNAHLLYFNRTKEIPFEECLDTLQNFHPEFLVTYFNGEHITTETILKHLKGRTPKTAYVSGAEIMVDTVGSELEERKFSVKKDWLTGYDETDY